MIIILYVIILKKIELCDKYLRLAWFPLVEKMLVDLTQDFIRRYLISIVLVLNSP